MRANETRKVTPEDCATECEWPECREQATCVRDTPWGDLPVCNVHAQTPLDGVDVDVDEP
jgi:hypothetical protein